MARPESEVAVLSDVRERGRPRSEADLLLDALRAIASARDLAAVMAAVRRAARRLLNADGATFVLREGEMVHYADEDAIGPLWKGRRFPAGACISGWAMLHRESVAIEDVYEDARIPHDAYRPTFVRSLAMVPIRREDPVGALGAYWARMHRATASELSLLEALAAAAGVAVANADLIARLEQAVRLRDDFLALASHELNTPVAALRLRGDALCRASGAEPSKVERFQRALRRVEETVRGLVEFSRASGGGFSLVRGTLDLAEVAWSAAAAARPRAEREGSELRVRAPEPVVGEWDRDRIARAIAHLLDNAVKFGRGRLIDVTVARSGGEATVAVRDRGPGVDAPDRDRIFGKFERACSPEHVSGLGLGLWMARAIAEAHGGTVMVGSDPGDADGGAVFTLRVPIRLPL